MLFVLAGLVMAVVVSLVRGGRLRHAKDATLRWSPILLLAFGLQVLADRLSPGSEPAGDLVTALLVVSHAALIAWCVVNWQRRGVGWVAAGIALNGLVIVANGGMPVWRAAVHRLGGDLAALPSFGAHHLMSDQTRLAVLGDTIPLWPLPVIISPGDILTVVGIVMLTHDVMTPHAGHGRRGDRSLVQDVRGS